MPRAFLRVVFAQNGRIHAFGRNFAERDLSQIRLLAFGVREADKIVFVLVAVARIQQIVPVPLAEIEGAFDRVPVLPLAEAVFLKDLFLYARQHDACGTSLDGEHIRQLIHGNVRTGALRFVIVCGIEDVILSAALHDVRVDGKRGQNGLFVFEPAVRAVADRHFDRLQVHVALPRREGGIIHIVHAAALDDAGRPIFVHPLLFQRVPAVCPFAKQRIRRIQLHAVCARRIDIIPSIRFEDVRVRLCGGFARLGKNQFHFLLLCPAKSAPQPRRAPCLQSLRSLFALQYIRFMPRRAPHTPKAYRCPRT